MDGASAFGVLTRASLEVDMVFKGLQCYTCALSLQRSCNEHTAKWMI